MKNQEIGIIRSMIQSYQKMRTVEISLTTFSTDGNMVLSVEIAKPYNKYLMFRAATYYESSLIQKELLNISKLVLSSTPNISDDNFSIIENRLFDLQNNYPNNYIKLDFYKSGVHTAIKNDNSLQCFELYNWRSFEENNETINNIYKFLEK